MIKRMQQGMAVFFCGERIRQFFVFLGVWTFLGFYKVLLWMQYMDVPFIFQCRSQLYVMAFSDMYMWALLFPFISYLTRRTFKNQKWYIHVLKQVPMSIVFSFLHIAFYYSVATYTDTSPYFSSSKKDFYEFLLSFLQYTLFFYLQVVAAVYLLEYRRLYKERMMKTTQLEKQLAVAKLHSLKMQLNPHFLFNSLNSIHTLMDVELPAAKKMLTRLSRFLRTTLDESEQMEITLQKEMEFIENYLEIEHIRFEDRLKVIYEIEPAVKQTAVPSFILQPLVENAIRHGVAPYAKHVEIIISGTLENDTVCLQVHDNGAGQTGSDSVQAASYTGIGETNGTGAREGIGLKNVRERLELHFGETQTFETCRLPEGGFVAKMTFPFKKAGSGSG